MLRLIRRIPPDGRREFKLALSVACGLILLGLVSVVIVVGIAVPKISAWIRGDPAFALQVMKFVSTRFVLPTAGTVIQLLLIGIVGVVLCGILCIVPWLQVSLVSDLTSKERFEKTNEARKTLAEIMGGLILFVGAYATFRNLASVQDQAKAATEQVEIARRGQATERFQKAVLTLHGTNAEAIAALYSLQEIGIENKDLDILVNRLVVAYIREGAKSENAEVNHDARSAVQVAIYVLRDRPIDRSVFDQLSGHTVDFSQLEFQGLDLSMGWLPGASFSGANLREANLTGTNLEFAHMKGADLRMANLSGSNLGSADLRMARLQGANLRAGRFDLAPSRGLQYVEESLGLPTQGAVADPIEGLSVALIEKSLKRVGSLNHASLAFADLSGAMLQGADLRATQLTGTTFEQADLSDADLTGALGLTSVQLSHANKEGFVGQQSAIANTFYEAQLIPHAKPARGRWRRRAALE